MVLVLVAAFCVVGFRGIEPFPHAGGGRAMVDQREAQYQQEQMERRQQEMDQRVRQQEADRSLHELEESGRRNEMLHKWYFFDD